MIEINTIKLINGDCLDKLKKIDNKSVNLVLIDPPYNISKAEWDKWKTVDDYVQFMGQVFLECQRVLKDNGSFYFFHNDFLQVVELQNWITKNTEFKFKQFITWNKRYPNCPDEFRVNATLYNEDLRNYKKYAEYILFYTKQEDTGLKYIDKEYIAPRNPFRKELLKARQEVGLSIAQVAEKGHFYGKVNHGGSVTNWEKGYNIPSKEQWELMKTFLPISKEFEELRYKYDELRKEYENMRYTFNNQKTHHSVWNYPIEVIEWHSTPKPVELIKNILVHSSNEGDMILDCFMGSCSTGIGCLETSRNFIGIELDNTYFENCKNRVNTYIEDNKLNNINIEIK